MKGTHLHTHNLPCPSPEEEKDGRGYENKQGIGQTKESGHVT